MARLNVQKTIEQGERELNPRYDMSFDDIIYIKNNSKDFYDLIAKGFYFGYAQGTKAAKAEMRRAQL